MGELLGVLSLVGDLGMGYPMEHAFRQTSAALRVAEALGLSDADREPIACGGLLAWVGCHVDAYEQAKWFGDEAAAKAEYQKVDAKNAAADLRYLVRQVGEGLSPLDRGRAVVALLSDLKEVERTLRTHGQAIDSLADHLGMSDAVRTTIEHNFERWDGRGPEGETASWLTSC